MSGRLVLHLIDVNARELQGVSRGVRQGLLCNILGLRDLSACVSLTVCCTVRNRRYHDAGLSFSFAGGLYMIAGAMCSI